MKLKDALYFSKPFDLMNTIADTVAYTKISQGIYPFAVSEHIINKVKFDTLENATPKSYESFSRSRSFFANITTASSQKFSSNDANVFKSSSQLEQDQSSQTFSPTETDSHSQSEDDIFSTFVKEVKAFILDESEAEGFDLDQLANEMAKEEYLRHQKRGKPFETFCMNPNVIQRISKRLAFKANTK